jgi:hypothetical protein
VEDRSTESSASAAERHTYQLFLQALTLGRVRRLRELTHDREKPFFLGVASIYTSIDSRRPPQVFVVEPTDAWLFHHPPLNRWLHTPPLGRVLAQR